MGMNEYYDWGELDDFYEAEDFEVLIDITILHKTDKAVLIQHKNRKAWFPMSVVSSLDEDCIEYKDSFDPSWTAIKNRMPLIEGDFI